MNEFTNVSQTPLPSTGKQEQSLTAAGNKQTAESQGVSPATLTWAKNMCAGIKRMSEDEEYRKEIANRLP